MDRPTCECHGLPTVSAGWRDGKQRWKCAVKSRESVRRYHKSQKGKDARKRWRESEHGRLKKNAMQREYNRRKMETDPWFPLKHTQRTRERRARQLEEKLGR